MTRASRFGHPQDYPLAALGTGDSHAMDPVEHSNLQFLGAIERLQKRIHELEHSTAPTQSTSDNGHPDGELKVVGDKPM